MCYTENHKGRFQMELYANLHTHSKHSDGGYYPRELARAAKAEGYGAIAVTDHDTATGYAELKDECDKLGLECIFGVEFSSPSSMLKDVTGLAHTFHIVGFHFDPEYPAMKQYLADMGVRESDQTRVLFERGVKLGLISGITWDEVLEFNKGIAWICNEQLYDAMYAKGLITHDKRQWYFRELFGDHRDEVPPCRDFKQEYEIIQLIKDAGGIAVLAHPHNQLQYMDALMEMGLEGLEIWHYEVDESEREAGLRLAYDKGLYISGGSDHRGPCSGYYERSVDLKNSRCYMEPMTCGTTKLHFEEIRDRKIKR